MPKGAGGLWDTVRRVIIFGLGVWVIVDSLTEKETSSTGKLIVGLLLLGVPPIDDLIRLATSRRRSREVPNPDGKD